jgi:alpha-mannosidase
LALRVVSITSPELFVGTAAEPRQVLRVELDGTRGPVTLRAEGCAVRSASEVQTDRVSGGVVELPMRVDGRLSPGERVPVTVTANDGRSSVHADGELVVAEPGWTMHMISHFHYDPVWWNTQAAYTSEWEGLDFAGSPRRPFQECGFDLVRAHLALARREPDYTFVLAEGDYLKPYWDMYPHDRDYLRHLLSSGRLELMGGMWNEPNTNLTNAESTIRNVIYGTGFQHDIVGGEPATAWQLDVFGHDPQFPGMMADAGLSSSSWARGPFHQWGPMLASWDAELTDATVMQFRTEFEWLSPSGRGVLTNYMAAHYSSGWWMDFAPTLESAEEAVYELFLALKPVAATRNVLLPVGTDYSPPNRWATRIHRHWNDRYVWPRFVCSLPKRFFAAVRAELAERGVRPSPQTRDMNPIYTGKDVSFIDTKQAQRSAEVALLDAEKWSTLAAILGADYPEADLDLAWRQLVYGAHHDGITGSESDQVYLDLLAGWRESAALATTALDNATTYLASRVHAGGTGLAVTVFNSLAWPRDDILRVDVRFDEPGWHGVRLVDQAGEAISFLCEGVERDGLGALAGLTLIFLATAVPSVGYRTWRLVPAPDVPPDASWQRSEETTVRNEFYEVQADADRGGGISRLVERATGRDLVREGEVANELVVYDEYPEHPDVHEGPWHILPRGTSVRSAHGHAQVAVERCALGERIVVSDGSVGPARYTQTVTVWAGVNRIDLRTDVDEWKGSDQLLRVRFPCPVDGALPVSEVGNAVVGRGFAFPDVDAARHPSTLDNPAYTWFGASATARVRLTEADGATGTVVERALGIAELVVADEHSAAPLCRDLAVALARVGVTATTSHADGPRYGRLSVDSNLPDFRVAIGGGPFAERVLDAAEPAYRREVQRQLKERGVARVWVAAPAALTEVWHPDADLTAPNALPVLVVVGAGAVELEAELAALVADLGDTVIEVRQPASLHPRQNLDNHTVAILNRGLPGFAVDARGALHVSLLRSCTGWPSGVWINPPRRTVPDGSGFQLQHWTHHFEYAFVSGPGDWRDNELVHCGHGYNHRMTAVVHHGTGDQPGDQSMLRVEPAGAAIVSALKPAGNPLATGRLRAEGSAAERVTMRLYEPNGVQSRVRIQALVPLADATRTDLLERATHAGGLTDDGALYVELTPAEIATVCARPAGDALGTRSGSSAGSRSGPPSFSRHWLHNRGVGRAGSQHVAVHLHGPGRVDGPTSLRCTVASDLVDRSVDGDVVVAAPPGWQAKPTRFAYRLAAGGHHASEIYLTPIDPVVTGYYAISAMITGPDDRRSEDVLLFSSGSVGVAPIAVELLDTAMTLAPGQQADLGVRITSRIQGAVNVELQTISPIETWDFAAAGSQDLHVPSASTVDTAVRLVVPAGQRPGTWWILVKAMGAGRVLYSTTIPVRVLKPRRVGHA